MSDPFRKDYAFLASGDRAVTHDEQMYSGALSFCRRRFARDLAGVDLAVIGVPFDTSVSNRPGCRFGPRGIRAASAQLSWSHVWPSPFDPFQQMCVVDWGDIDFDYGQPDRVPGQIEAAISHVIGQDTAALCLGGDHFITYPSLRAHAGKHGPGISLIQFGPDRPRHHVLPRRARRHCRCETLDPGGYPHDIRGPVGFHRL
jgi:agmatinase